LRFFIEYGPRQRPDLAINKFIHLINNNLPVPLYGNRNTKRDYTYVTDIIRGIVGALNYVASSFRIVNIGNNQLHLKK
jgi:UDP-glucuronate 4-epimerase